MSEIPEDGRAGRVPEGKNRLLVGPAQVEDILRGFGLPEFAGTIEIADSQTGKPFATLAKIEKGKMKWSHKLVNEKTLLVEFGKEDYPAILARVKEKSARPGFQIQIVDAKTGQIAGKCECSFLSLPDLVVTIQYPGEGVARPGAGKRTLGQDREHGDLGGQGFRRGSRPLRG